jgi:hypothetical protein
VHKRNKDGTYNITFDDGDSDRRVKAEDVGVYNPDDFEVLSVTLCVSLRALNPKPLRTFDKRNSASGLICIVCICHVCIC